MIKSAFSNHMKQCKNNKVILLNTFDELEVPKKAVVIDRAFLHLEHIYELQNKIFVNGDKLHCQQHFCSYS